MRLKYIKSSDEIELHIPYRRYHMYFPDEYFKEETRDGFTISEMMKRAWAATIEVLDVIDNICTENNITWFADYGTLLGTIRHKGYIPWDDDIDIMLLRSDYDKLISILPSTLPEGFVLAGMYSNEERLQKAARVYQSRVMADETILSLAKYMSRFHGFPYPRIGIDIFPVDKIAPTPEEETERNTLLNRILELLYNWNVWKKTPKFITEIDWINKTFETDFPYDEKIQTEIWRLEDNLRALYENSDSKIVKFGINIDCFKSAIRMPFENAYQMAVPIGYDEVLTKEFGDYMTPVKNSAGHDYPFYKNQEKEFTKMLRESGVESSPEEFVRNWMLLMKKTGTDNPL